MNSKGIEKFLSAVGYKEQPMGLVYTPVKPDSALTPKEAKHSCILNYIRLAREKGVAAWFETGNKGCIGGQVYSGYLLPPPAQIPAYVTSGNEYMEGERYLKGPESMHRFFKEIDLQFAPDKYCVFKPLNLFKDNEKPMFVTFFARGELLSGLCQIIYFTLDDINAIMMPFGAGCSNLIAWPLHYLRKNERKAVLGGSDPSARPYLGMDEMTLTVSYEIFMDMIEAAPESFLYTKSWKSVLKKIDMTDKVWQEKKAEKFISKSKVINI